MKICKNPTPPWFTGHWRDWHRGHGCEQDDGKPRSATARTEIDQHAAFGADRLTDAQVAMLRARTTSGDTEMCMALDELVRLRADKAAERDDGLPETPVDSHPSDCTCEWCQR